MAQLSGVGIRVIACGMMHSGCVLNDGSVYQWGTCGDYQAVNRDMKNSKEFLQKSICQYPTKVSFRNCLEVNTTASQSTGLSARRKSAQEQNEGEMASPMIADIKMGEQFTVALSMRGYIYTWGMNDKGQLGVGNDSPAFEPIQVPQIGPTAKHTIKPITKIGCGLKHVLVLTKNCQLYSWGSNLQCQLGKKLNNAANGPNGQAGVQVYSSVPVHVTAYEQAVPIMISSGAYHNVILSRALPKIEEPTFDNQIVTQYGLVGDASHAKNTQQMVVYDHKDEDCPHIESMKKLKSEIKRLRQELILKPTSKKKNDEEEGLDTGFSEEEKQAIRMLSQEQRKMLSELEQAGCNREYIKKKIRACIMNQDQGFMYMMDENRVFYQNNEIPFD